METILITGATGNVGKEVIQSLLLIPQPLKIVAGVRNPEKEQRQAAYNNVTFHHFDFEDQRTFAPALQACDVLFLLRPPQLADVKTYFVPLIQAAKASGVKHIVFLSVQGVEHSKVIPHHKIERLIRDSGIPYTFIRPAYFMQNFTTTLRQDIIDKRLIFLPAGKARFTVIDIKDIGAACAVVLANRGAHINKSYALTNNEKLTFGEMAQKISAGIGTSINFVSPNLLRFFLQKKGEGVAPMFILVMIMLHYLPRFQKEPPTSDCVQQLTGRPPITFDQFVQQHKHLLTK